MTNKFDHTIVEKKWQKKWEEEKLYVADIQSSRQLDSKTTRQQDAELSSRPVAKKFYNLWMFPYPSAEGMHAGHAFSSTGSDVYGRYMRMNGYEVFQPFGYDSFGIHSENYAIKINENPHEVVKRTTANYEKQMRSLGHGYDWTRTVTTSDPLYYRWTQWLFTEMFKSGLAYKKKASVNFCPSCKTVLADEQVMTPKQAGKEPKDADGNVISDPPSQGFGEASELKVCERCGTVAKKRELDQWFMRITDYAERLLNGLTQIDWSERVKLAQKEWIGKKEGINITYDIKGYQEKVTVFTTAPVNFGATFIVVAPEYARENLVKIIPEENIKEVNNYIETSLKESDAQRTSDKEKTGAFTGLYAINHLNGKELPIWVTDFVLSGVGTGAVQGCPGHDVRDFQFAKKFGIDIPRVVVGEDGYDGPIEKESQVVAHGMKGKFVNSNFLNGMDFEEGLQKTMDYFEEKGWGKRVVTYHLRDWLISRQRYWGAPIPMIFCESCAQNGEGYLTFKGLPFKGLHKDHSDWESEGWWPEENLPVLLPPMKEYKPDGSANGPLAHHPEFYTVKCPHCGEEAQRETDVMDTFVDSSWYFLRYPSVNSGQSTVGYETAKKYGSQFTVHSSLPFDPEITKKWLPVNLYFGGAEHSVLHLMYARFVNMVMFDKKLVPTEEPFPKFFAHGLMIKDGAKMSKSRGNVVNPDDYIKKFGADVMRMYEMFLGPMDGNPDFRDSGIEGMERFLGRVWRLFQMPNAKCQMPNGEVLSKLHITIKGVTEDIKGFKYNTAIAKIMELVNCYTENRSNLSSSDLKPLALLLAPFAPHMMEEVWVELGMPFSIHKAAWPTYDPKMIVQSEAIIMIQVNGKVRSQLNIEYGMSNMEKEVVELAKKDGKVAKYLEGQAIKKTIFIPGKLVNFVI